MAKIGLEPGHPHFHRPVFIFMAAYSLVGGELFFLVNFSTYFSPTKERIKTF